MDSASFSFVLFGLAVALASNLSRSRRWRSVVLLLSSLVFLGLLVHNPVALLPFAGFLLLGYAGLMLAQRGSSKSFLVSVVAIIFVFFWLKKYTFLPAGIFLRFPYFTLGLSYVFFRVLQLVIEMAGSGEEVRIGPGAYLTYTLNFTTLVSGPIQGYKEFSRDAFAEEPPRLGAVVVGQQIERIILGFFKVNVLAFLLNMIRQDAMTQVLSPNLPLSPRFYAALQLSVIYPFFLYCNFSGYIDIVIGLARLMRIELPENFNRPFSAPSFLEFWNRWHMTLSNWLKTFVYNPLLLSLMRRFTDLELQPWLAVVSFFVTFFLIGIWHGRTSEFAVYGVLLGGGVAVNKLWQIWLAKRLGKKGYKALAARRVYIAFARGLTFSFFSFSLFWFWGDWHQLSMLLQSLGAVRWVAVWLLVWCFMTGVLEGWEWLRGALFTGKASETSFLQSRYARVVYASTLALVSFLTLALLDLPAPDIVYKAF